MKDEIVREILDRLAIEYPEAGCALEHRNPFELLVATVLSAQTTDKSVNKVTPALFAKYPDAKALGAADPKDVEQYIKRIGMYHQKAKNIVALSASLAEKYDGKVPQDFNKLTELSGVGRKTANVVLAEAFGEQHIAVDTHVFRVSNRIGLAHEKDVLKTEKALMETLPENRWTEAHHLLIFHGRNCCSARKPDCANCCVRELCERNGLD
ncbi:MAG: endonuclease III [Eubacteriales bacterium]|nr:endonuclease III [Eubacteriales bacterium]